MLDLLRARCQQVSPSAARQVQTHHTDAISYLVASDFAAYDVMVTHFFLDCFTQTEIDILASAASVRLVPGAVWLLSDFSIPPGRLRYPAKFLVRSLYLAFRILTGLRVSRLPDYAAALTPAGFTRVASCNFLFGMLTTELWIHALAPVGDETSRS